MEGFLGGDTVVKLLYGTNRAEMDRLTYNSKYTNFTHTRSAVSYCPVVTLLRLTGTNSAYDRSLHFQSPHHSATVSPSTGVADVTASSGTRRAIHAV